MAGSSRRTTVLSSVACALLLITAGCATDPAESPSRTTTTATDTPTEELTTATSTAETTETSRPNRTSDEQANATTTKGVFGSIEEELKVNNYLDSTERVRVEIESDNGTVVLDENLRISRNSSREFDFEFPHTGAYNVAVNTSVGNETQTWNVTRRNPTVTMSVVLIDDELHVGLEAI